VIDTDIALIEYARRCGETVSVRQLKRWRSDGLLPARTVRGRGRGHGVTGFDAPWTRFQCVAVSRALSYERNNDRAALRLWYQGWDIPTELIVRQIDQRLERDRQCLTDLQRTVGTGTDNEMAGFDVAEADSQARPITHDEIARMREAAHGTDESAHDLVHAVRTAIEGQLFSPANEVLAIPEELAKHYLNFTSIEQLLTPGNESLQPAFDTFTAAIQELTADDVLRAPTANALTTARSWLRRMYDAAEIVSNYEPQPDEADLIAPARSALAYVDTSYDPRSSDYDPEQLILGLRTAAQAAFLR